MDEHSSAVIDAVNSIPEKGFYTGEDIAKILNTDFDAALTAFRLFLGLSKDEFGIALRTQLGEGGTGVTRFRNDPKGYLLGLENLGVMKTIAGLVNKPVGWRDILVERLKYGRGSAIKGQKRGRSLEDFTEGVVKLVFGMESYDFRCRFVGASGESTEKADFAIPNRKDARILIESKGYGATGSKQTDILGRHRAPIANQKRPDTHLLLVTDGVTWRNRQSDLAKLVYWQNQGRIARIYTQAMAAQFETDLRQLRKEHSLE